MAGTQARAFGGELADRFLRDLSINSLVRLAAGYVDRIARGAKPADVPIEQAAKFELVVNLKTAKALGITLSPDFLSTADEAIE